MTSTKEQIEAAKDLYLRLWHDGRPDGNTPNIIASFLASRDSRIIAEARAEYSERVAQLTAHRACGGVEHDPMNGKFHGNCVVCLVPWPCEYAGTPPVAAVERAKIAENRCESGCEGSGRIRVTNNGKGRQDIPCPSGCAPKIAEKDGGSK